MCPYIDVLFFHPVSCIAFFTANHDSHSHQISMHHRDEQKVLQGILQVSSGPHQQTNISTYTRVQQTATDELVGYAWFAPRLQHLIYYQTFIVPL